MYRSDAIRTVASPEAARRYITPGLDSWPPHPLGYDLSSPIMWQCREVLMHGCPLSIIHTFLGLTFPTSNRCWMHIGFAGQRSKDLLNWLSFKHHVGSEIQNKLPSLGHRKLSSSFKNYCLPDYPIQHIQADHIQICRKKTTSLNQK